MEVLALVSAAAAFNIVHADDDRVLAAVHHAGLHRMSVTAVALAPRAVTTLEFPANLAEWRSSLVSVCLRTIPKHSHCMQAAYLQLVCTCMLVWGGAVGHGCQASGAPRDQQGSTGQQLGHQAHAWAHVVQIWTESHTGTCCQGVCHWECCLRKEVKSRNARDKTSYCGAFSANRSNVRFMFKSRLAGITHYGLQLGSRQHELHLLCQHGCRGLLLDQVVPPIDLQLGLQVWRRVKVLTVLTGAASLRTEDQQALKAFTGRKSQSNTAFWCSTDVQCIWKFASDHSSLVPEGQAWLQHATSLSCMAVTHECA